MDRDKLFSIIEGLDLLKGEWVVFGGACLTARSIRSTADLELFVTRRLYMTLAKNGWKERVTGSTGANYVTKIFGEIPVLAFITCGSEKWQPRVHNYLKQPEIIDGVPFMPLSEMYKWKAATARPKDLDDIKLIDNYWQSKISVSY